MTGEIAGWSDEALRQTLATNLGVGSDAGLPEDIRFRAGVIRIIRHRIARANERDETPSVFVLGEPPADLSPSDLKLEPMLDNGLTVVANHIWFVGPGAAQAHGLAIADWDDATVFTQAMPASCRARPTILFETRTPSPEARFYPDGLGSPDVYEPLLLSVGDLGLDDVLTAIDRVHREMLVTPVVQPRSGKLWANTTSHWPVENAEDLIQLYLRSGLVGAFPSCRVRAEQSQATGRLDLEIEEPNGLDLSQVVRHALLELKVLRSFGSTGIARSSAENEQWIADGVDQAAAYRDDRGCRAAALCAFDMRVDLTEDACFAHVAATAKKKKVRLRCWHLFASAKAYRDALAALGT